VKSPAADGRRDVSPLPIRWWDTHRQPAKRRPKLSHDLTQAFGRSTMPGVTDEEAQIQEAAIAYAKANRKEIVARLTDTAKFPGEDMPVSVFMAGSPGAGKTEASIELLASLDGPPVLRIDPDELRCEFPGYTGGNAWLFQRAVTVIVERIHDTALKQSQSFLLDGTLSNYSVAEGNITRSLNKGRPVQILYVYQEPLSAWKFVQAREQVDGRAFGRKRLWTSISRPGKWLMRLR
jgi:UDP-N-acetylglucosamine kinase